MNNAPAYILACCFFVPCKQVPVNQKLTAVANHQFNPESLVIRDNDTSALLRGQALYLPVYSNMPHQIEAESFYMNAFVSVHNTGFINDLTVTRTLYLNNEGDLVHGFMPEG